MRVDAGSCGNGVGCVAGTDVDGESDTEGDAEEEVVTPSAVVVLEEMPKSAVVVPEST